MFCGKCGAKNPDDAVCCQACGASMEGLVIAPATAQPTSQPPRSPVPPRVPRMPRSQPAARPVQPGGPAQPGNPGQPMPGAGYRPPMNNAPKKKLPVALIGGIAAAVVAAIVLIVVFINASSTINLNKYLEFEVTGYNGYGKVHATIDWDAIEDKYGDKVSFTKAARQEFGGLLSMTTPTEVLQSDVYVDLDQSKGLSNGDTVAYTWDIDEEVAKYLKCKIKYKDGTFNVTDLMEVGKFDAFADLKVTFSGTAPDGSIEISYSGSELSTYDFDYDRPDQLRNGDVVTVTLDESVVESCAENYGKVPDKMAQDYTVDGLASYVEKLADLDDATLAAMKKQAEDVYNAKVASDWDTENVTLNSLTYLGDYLQVCKPGAWGDRNAVYLIYKANVGFSFTNDDGETYEATKDVYWYTYYNEVKVAPDGTLVTDVSRYHTPNDRFKVDSEVRSGYGTKYWYLDGYENLDELYQKRIMSSIDTYEHEDNVTDS